MRTLKGSILSRSSHNGESFKAQRRALIESWLKEYNIKNYTIKDDFTIDVDGNVYLGLKNITEFPEYIQFNIVKRDFDCSFNHLSSLRGVPREVGRDFYCNINELISLEGSPREVGGDFYCNHNTTKFTENDVRKVCDVKGDIYNK